ncbi:conjugal transfer protein TrbD, partial [Pannonibacter phragmitetus]|uniref:conjugal transfer protein TrbD n=1 Tax=Pannonibacter phragmitetus TaxID=121719 RepID=UPI00197E05F5
MAEVGNKLDRARIHRALSRPTLLFGADRELVLVTGLLAVILVFVVLTMVSAILGAVIWIVVVGILRMMAKADPASRHESVESVRLLRTYGDHAARMDVSR